MKKYNTPFVNIIQICPDVIVTSVNREDNDWSDADFKVKENTL